MKRIFFKQILQKSRIQHQYYAYSIITKKFLKIGDSASLTKTFTAKDVEQFATLSLDTNPIHTDEEYVKQHGVFKKRVVHGMLLGGLISAVAGTKLPGPGSVYVSQDFQFCKPAHVDEAVTATVKLLAGKANLFHFETIITNENGEVLVSGKASVYNPNCFIEKKNS